MDLQQSNLRTLTPTGSRLKPFPRIAAIVLLVACLIGVPASPSGRGFFHMAALVGAFAACAIAAWAELRLYRGLVGARAVTRIVLSLLVPVLALAVSPLLIVGAGIVSVADDGILLCAVFAGLAWFVSACFGTNVIVGLDIVISALIPDFRSRIQAAVLGLLAVTVGIAFGVYVVGQRAAAVISEAARTGALGESIKIGITSETDISGKEALTILAQPETERFLAQIFVFVAVVLMVPALLSACGKLADAVMERLNPLSEAMEAVGRGDLGVRVEVGGSRDLVQITEGFNRMTGSLAVTLGTLEQRNRELSETNVATSRFVPFQFLDLLHKESIRDIQRGDQTQLEMSIMFCDIRGFTTMAERIGPEATFAFINRYLSHMEAEIHRENGFINDFFGDGIMALFHTGADSAVRAALGMLAAVDRFNAALREEGKEPIRIGIGLNSGTLMLGTIGGKDRLSCSVVGDPANTAARVEGMTKLYGASVIISDGTYRRLEDPSRYAIREIDRVQAMGKLEAMAIYEVLDGEPAEQRAHKLRTRTEFAEALLEYRKGAFDAAVKGFASCVGDEEDAAAALYVERCEHWIAEGPPSDWNGITALREK